MKKKKIIININIKIINTINVIFLESSFIFNCNGVSILSISFSDNAILLNAPRGFNIHVKDLKISNGAGFVVVYTGNILTMPGLPKVPQAVKMQDY